MDWKTLCKPRVEKIKPNYGNKFKDHYEGELIESLDIGDSYYDIQKSYQLDDTYCVFMTNAKETFIMVFRGTLPSCYEYVWDVYSDVMGV